MSNDNERVVIVRKEGQNAWMWFLGVPIAIGCLILGMGFLAKGRL